MPKANKTSKKKTSKIYRFTSWLKPTTPLKAMILFALVFAITGGGYYAYKSHAASWTVFAKDFYNFGNTQIVTDSNSSKGSVTTAKLLGFGSSFTARIYTNFVFPKQVFVCAVARAQVSSANPASPTLSFRDVSAAGTTIGGSIAHDWTSVPQGSTYNQYCAGPTTVAGGQHFLDVSVQRYGPSNSSQIYVSAVNMQY